jgi:glycosyltransferase involved in cell wall biosynthesis
MPDLASDIDTMKILFSSYAYAPGIGGIETVSALLAHEFIAAGHDLILITETPGNATSNLGDFEVVRQPSLPRLWNLLWWCDIVFQNNISLRHLIPALLAGKPILVVHQTWIRNVSGAIGWIDRLKRALSSRVKNVAVSKAVAADLGTSAEIIGNLYDDNIFKIQPNITRDRNLIFVGRLVSDKGADVLIRALGILKQRNLISNLTIIGHGPDEDDLHALVRELKLDDMVTFAGQKSGGELAESLNRHQVIVIPSRWAEPFGIVALEGIACGCIAVGSANGGLPEAIGNCGMIFRNGDSEELADRLAELLGDSKLREKFRAARAAHLEQFRAHTIAQRYLTLLHDVYLASH